MWALRRASNPLKHRGFTIGTSRASSAKSEILRICLEDNTGLPETSQLIHDRHHSMKFLYNLQFSPSEIFMARRNLSSQAGSKSSDGEVDSESELSHDDGMEDPSHDEIDVADVNEKVGKQRGVVSAFSKAVINASSQSVVSVLEAWVEKGNDLKQIDISRAIMDLRRRRMYGKALQFLQWLERSQHVEFNEQNYASRVDLIAKTRGIHRAESYIDKIPKSFQSEVVYRTLLANCVLAGNIQKAVQIFDKMRSLKFRISYFSWNQLLFLYKRHDKKQMESVLLLMEKENMKPSLITYKLLIDAKGQLKDVNGMDQMVEKMKAEGIEPDLATKAVLATHYASCGLNEKAEAISKEIEEDNLKEKNRWACRTLLTIYASLGKADDVSRIWNICSGNPHYYETRAAIEAYGKLGKIPEADAVFEETSKGKKPSPRLYSTLLKLYANHKLLDKVNELVKRMNDSELKIEALALDPLLRLYVELGDVKEAESVLRKSAQKNLRKPMLSTYMVIMNEYAKSGEVDDAERIFGWLKRDGYGPRLQPYVALVKAYANAKLPAYGFRARMKADNVFPNKEMSEQLVQLESFRIKGASGLHD